MANLLSRFGVASKETETAEYEHRVSELTHRIAQLQQEAAAVEERSEVGVVLLDSRRIILRTNARAHSLLGMVLKDPVGRPLAEAALSPGLDDMARAVANTALRQSRELRHPPPDGSWLSVTATPLPAADAPSENGNGHAEPLRILLVIRDITELRRLEMVRRDFVANVSHELRTPLAAIRAMAETLLDGGALEDAEAAERFLKTIVAEIERLTRISDDLLTLTDAEASAPRTEPIDYSNLARAVTARFETASRNAGIQFDAGISDGLTLTANRDQIEQVLINLIDNAIKYTPAGGSVRVTASHDETGAVITRIADTGLGIPSQDLPRIFERFYRVDKARSRQSGGTGLGLSIVKRIVEAHGGFVRVESELNRGSTFTFALPRGPELPSMNAA